MRESNNGRAQETRRLISGQRAPMRSVPAAERSLGRRTGRAHLHPAAELWAAMERELEREFSYWHALAWRTGDPLAFRIARGALAHLREVVRNRPPERDRELECERLARIASGR